MYFKQELKDEYRVQQSSLCIFTFPGLLPKVNLGPQTSNGNSRNKRPISFTLRAILSVIMKLHIVPLWLPQDRNRHPFTQHLHTGHTPQPSLTEQLSGLLDRLLRCHNACAQVTLNLLHISLKAKTLIMLAIRIYQREAEKRFL